MVKDNMHKSRSTCFFFFLLSLALFFVGCQGRSVIVNNVSEREANEIVVLLASKGIEAVKGAAPIPTTGGGNTQVTWDISVPASQITEALSILNRAGLPRVKGTSLLSLFGAQGLVPSDLQDQIRYQEGLSEQLANTIRKMDGVLDADVQITFPKENATDQTLTASIYIKHQGMLDNPNSLLITKIKRLVASAIPGLKIENVSVVADRALYSDISLNAHKNALSSERDYVSIWSIIVAQESANRFRLIFYIFLILLFLFFCSTAWLIWKLYPWMRQRGWRHLFTLEQIASSDTTEVDRIPPPPSENL